MSNDYDSQRRFVVTLLAKVIDIPQGVVREILDYHEGVVSAETLCITQIDSPYPSKFEILVQATCNIIKTLTDLEKKRGGYNADSN